MQRSVLSRLALVLALGGAGAVFAQTAEQAAAIAERQAHMKAYSDNLRPLGEMVQGGLAYDAAAARTAAANLAALAAVDQSGFWLDGTAAGVSDSRAKPEIWTDPAGYAQAQQALSDASAALVLVAGDGIEALRAGFGPVGASCGACHETYRAPRN